ncbi:MAG: domain protein putative component of TonB system [Myxococcaceae bacterium]|nr:domain protein putative component of TonB system [Myxococcaceae bacterium]
MRHVRMVALVAAAAMHGALPYVASAQDKDEEKTSKKASVSASSSASGGQCIAPSVVAAVDECPAGAAKLDGKTSLLGKSQAPKSNLSTSERKKEAPKERPMGPSVDIDQASLRGKGDAQVRAAKLLEKEITVLKRLAKNTPNDSPKRPEILLRVAETYFEMQQSQNAKVRSFDEPIFQAQQAKDKNKVKQLQAQQQEASKKLDEYRKESIKAYAQMVQDHPNFKRMDEVLFALAFSLDEMKQSDKARDVYYRLIKNYPESKFVPNAYLSFAEHYFATGDMQAANKFYAKVTEFPPERNAVYGFAIYKQAWCLYNIEDYKGSLGKFVETIEFGKSHPEARDVANLMKQSRRELVMPYARVGTPAKAFEFFSRFAVDEAQAYDMLESLAELYYDTGDWGPTVQTYHKLMSEAPNSDKLCYWQSRVANAELASGNKQKGVTEVTRLVDVYETIEKGDKKEDVKKQCKQYAAQTLVDLATAWHREAIGTDTQPGTNDRKTMQLATQLYRLLLEKFPDMGTMEFPAIDKRDWPNEYRVSYFYAELLWKMEQWAECAPAFDKVVDLDPKGDFTADAALAAVLCYNNLYQQQFAGGEKTVNKKASTKPGKKGKHEDDKPDMGPREFTPLEGGMLKAFQRYVCFVPNSEDLATMKYRRARIYYEANRYDEAAVIFKDIAYNHKDSELSEYAANLYLDSLNVMASMREGDVRPQCYDQMAVNVPEIHGIYCATDAAKSEHEGLCGPLEQLRCDIQRKKAEAHQSKKEFRDAAYTYVNIFRKYPECGKLDEVLYNAAINFEATKLVGRAIKVRGVLIDKFPESPLAKKAVYLTGANFQALALYPKAADYYETFATKYPNEDGKACTEAEKAADSCPKAADALQDAVFFRLGLGDDAKALDDAKLYEKNFSKKYPRETSQVVYSLASIYERSGDWKKVAESYQTYLKNYGRQALINEEIRANTQIGVAYWKLDKKSDAEKYFKAATKLWSGGAVASIEKSSNGDADKATKAVAEGSQAVAQALWYLAEFEFAKFDKIEFPEIKGKADMKKVNEWAQGSFVKWIEEKAKALKNAEDAYGKVREMKAPMWDIAAAERIGVMYRTFVDDFRDAPVPDEIKKDPELMDIYLGSLDEKSQPWVVKATGAFDFCMGLATQVRWFNEFSQQCEQELNKLDPRKYPLAAELRGGPGYVQQKVADPVAARIGGKDEEE